MKIKTIFLLFWLSRQKHSIQSATIFNLSFALMENREKITKAYVDYVLENGKMPPTAYVIAKQLAIDEKEFYNEYNSLQAVEADVWLQFFEQARQQTVAQDVYERNSVREKLLSFYYTWVEALKANRSFVLYAAGPQRHNREMNESVLAPFKRAFIDYAHELVSEGRTTGEVVNRPLVTERYADGFWLQALFVLRFWVRDNSQGYELTDAAIEKAVNTSFDFIGKSAFDSLFDLGKFIYQTQKAGYGL